ncbi:hypothetical protein Gogos_002266, partial [Gossypium gossypioides]|nr:hypothetical protein [Gossypium gossypioides]
KKQEDVPTARIPKSYHAPEVEKHSDSTSEGRVFLRLSCQPRIWKQSKAREKLKRRKLDRALESVQLHVLGQSYLVVVMMAALSLAPSPLSIVTTTKPLFPPCKSMLKLQTPRGFKATPVGQDNSTVDYSSTASVFPAEACDTLGGEACDVEMFPEVKLKPDQTQSNKGKTGSEQVDREYLEYNSPKTVFIGEACDDLGGEFCEPEYQKGVQ